MIVKNAENQASGTWGTQESSYTELDRNQCEGSRLNCGKNEGEPIATDRADRERANSFSKSGGDIPGGMFEQFIADIEEDIKECAERSERLHNRLNELKKVSAQLKKNTEDS